MWDFIRFQTRATGPGSVRVRLGIRRGRRLAAYVLGRRYPSADSFALDEFAYVDDEAAALMPALIRNAAGDLRKITGWLPPDPARSVVPRGAVRVRRSGIAMILPLSTGARAAWERAASGVSARAVRSLLERRPHLAGCSEFK